MAKSSTLSELAAKRRMELTQTLQNGVQKLRTELDNLKEAEDISVSDSAKNALSEIRKTANDFRTAGSLDRAGLVTRWAEEMESGLAPFIDGTASEDEPDLHWIEKKVNEFERIQKETMAEINRQAESSGVVRISRSSSVKGLPAIPVSKETKPKTKPPASTFQSTSVAPPIPTADSRSIDSWQVAPANSLKKTPPEFMTLDELSEFVSSEIRDGLLDTVGKSPLQRRIDFGDKGLLINGIGSLIGRIRETVTERSGGQIQFADRKMGFDGSISDEGLDSLLGIDATKITKDHLKGLSGMKAVVADDDEKIAALFEDALSWAGMNVQIARDGRQALEMISKDPPDVIIADILMPEMDGWELATRLRWDISLMHIPVVMISWKEDFLQRVRELRAGADGYMRKEEGHDKILESVAGVLKFKLALDRKLSAKSDVAGRIEAVGTLSVIKSAMERRGDCKITLREKWNYFEVIIRAGELVAITRTGTDGSFDRGGVALRRLLGTTGGKFHIQATGEKPKKQFEDGSFESIRKTAAELTDLCRHVVDGELVNIQSMEMNSDVLDLYKEVAPPKIRQLLQHLLDGKAPRDLVLNASASIQTLEMLLLDLVRTSAIQRFIAFGAAQSIAGESPVSTENADKSSAPAQPVPLHSEDLKPSHPTSEKKPIVPLSAPSMAPPRPASTKLWPVIAAIFFACFVAMVVLKWIETDSEEGGAALASTSEISDVPRQSEPPKSPPPIQIATPKPIAIPKTVHPPIAEAEPKLEPKPEPSPDPVTEKRSESEKEPGPAATTYAEKATLKNPPAVTETAPAAGGVEDATSVLFIKTPDDAPGRIKVSIGNKVRGRTPVKLKLVPGLHEIVYSFEGTRTIQRVKLEPDEKKTIFAKVPR